MSGVSNGQTANQTTFNNAFMTRNGDTNTIGKLDLENAEAESGDSIFNAQREHNANRSYLGLPVDSLINALPTWIDTSVGTGNDDITMRAEALTAEFNPTSGHAHDGSDSALIDATDLDNVRLKGSFVRATNLTAVTGSSVVVTTEMSGKTPSTGDTVKGVVVSTNNQVILRDAFGDDIISLVGDMVYGRIEYSVGVWTLSFYTNIAGTQTPYSMTSQNITWYYQELFNPMLDSPIYSEIASVPSDNATQDVVDASATQRGVVSTGTQHFAGQKFIDNTTQSTTKDTGALVLEGGLGVEKNINAGGNIVATGTMAGSNLSGTNTGDVTLAAFGSTPDAKGATISGQAVALQPADATHPGLMDFIAQSLGGLKTWIAGQIFSTFIAFVRGDTASTASITQLTSATTFRKLTGTTATTIHGILATAEGRVVKIYNGTNQDATIKHQSGSALAADRIVLPGGVDLTLSANSTVGLIYDLAQSLWVLEGGSGSGTGGGALVVTGSRASPQSITAGGGIAFTGVQPRQMWFVQGDTTDIDVTVNPQIAAGSTVGQELIVVGRNDTQSLKLEDGTGLSLKGEIYLVADSVLGLVWDGTNWNEMFRSG